jgi:fatty-acyl-CoA synthase
MAAIIADPGFVVATLHQHLSACLPTYARPVFVRIGKALQITGTFKPTKAQFIRDGYDPNETDDAIYFDDRRSSAYVRLDSASYATIQNAEARL